MSHHEPRLAAAAATALFLAFSLAQAEPASPAMESTAGTRAETPIAGDGMSVEATFSKADANHDGNLSKDELASMPAMQAKFESLDKNKDGALNLKEFSAGTTT